MKEHDVLAGIRDHVRAERADDAALEAVARGETGTGIVAELEKRADGDPDLAAMLKASRPLGDDVIAKIAARATPRSVVVPFSRRVAIYAGPVALAAAMLLYVGLREPVPSGALLPDYSVAASSQKEMRGADESLPTLALRGGPEAEFEIVARPATAAGQVVAYAFAIGEGEPNPVDARIEIAPEGSVRIRGRARALEGAREVRVVLGVATDSIKRYEDALSRAREGTSDAKIRVLVVPIVRP
jgi:hypothetical protein